MMRLQSGPGPGSSSPPPATARAVSVGTAVVVAGDEESRVLLRGLLRLHRFRVVGEAEGVRQGVELVRAHRPQLLIADAVLGQGSLSDLVGQSRDASEGIRVVLVAPASRGAPFPAGGATPDVVLQRPFRIRQFAEALGGATSSA